MFSRFLLAVLFVALGLVTTPPAPATSYGPPSPSKHSSPNGKYVLKVDPEKDTHTIYRGRKRLWSFRYDVWYYDYFISDDGQRVACVKWEYISLHFLDDPVVTIHGPKGVIAEYKCKELSKPRRYPKGDEAGRPIGQRLWRDKAWQEGDEVVIDVMSKDHVRIPLHQNKSPEASGGRRSRGN